MATKIVRSNNDNPEKEPQKAVKKASEDPKAGSQTVKPAAPTKGSSVGYRIGAVVLWILAIACEICCILILTGALYVPNKLLFLIIGIVLDLILAIIAAQLWKKANRIKPMSKKNKFLFYLWNELGVIMACVCFIPLIIILLKNDKLDKKTKTIAAIVAVVALLITGVASADFHPISAEQKQDAEAQITTDVYWTQFGHKYHLNADEETGCPHIRNSSTLYKGSVAEAIESGRTAICSYCAAHYAEEMGLELANLNVEDKDSVLAELGGGSQTEAPNTTGGN